MGNEPTMPTHQMPEDDHWIEVVNLGLTKHWEDERYRLSRLTLNMAGDFGNNRSFYYDLKILGNSGLARDGFITACSFAFGLKGDKWGWSKWGWGARIERNHHIFYNWRFRKSVYTDELAQYTSSFNRIFPQEETTLILEYTANESYSRKKKGLWGRVEVILPNEMIEQAVANAIQSVAPEVSERPPPPEPKEMPERRSMKSKSAMSLPMSETSVAHVGESEMDEGVREEPSTEVLEYARLLNSWGLGEYIPVFEREGWIDPVDWQTLSVREDYLVNEMGLKRGMAVKFIRCVNNIKGQFAGGSPGVVEGAW